MHASRISDVATARHALREGLVDLVGMTRAQIADPHLVAKVAAGDEDRIRPCVGANYCLDAIYQSGRRQVHPQPRHRAGADPHPRDRTGLRRARRRSSSVPVPRGSRRPGCWASGGTRSSCSRRPTLPGGQVRLAAAAARRRDLIGIVDWRVAEAKHSRRRVPLRRLRGQRRPCWRSTPTSSSSRRAACRTMFLVEGGPGHRHVGRDGRCRAPAGIGPRLRRQRCRAGAGRHRAAGRPRRRTRVRHAGADLAPLVGSMNSPAYLSAFAEHDVTVTLGPPARRGHCRPPTGTGGWRGCRQRVRRHRGRAARRPRRRRARHAAERRAVLRPGAALAQPRRRRPRAAPGRAAADRPHQPRRASSSCSGSATQSPAATSTPPRTTRCVCARPI